MYIIYIDVVYIQQPLLQNFFCKHRPLMIIDVSSYFGARGPIAPGVQGFHPDPWRCKCTSPTFEDYALLVNKIL